MEQQSLQPNSRIAIAGAGIGGLTTALALLKKGYSPVVYEQAPEIKAVGAGIILGHNANQVFKKLGVYDEIASQATVINNLSITDERLKKITVNKVGRYHEKYGVSNLGIRRSALHAILAARIPKENLHLGFALKAITQDAKQVKLEFDHTTLEVDCLIGADGIHSVVRKSIFNNTALRDAHQACWRGIASFELPEEYRDQLIEAWGKSKRFGFVPVGHHSVYWYALKTNTGQAFKTGKPELLHAFKEFAFPVSRILEATDEQHILRNDIFDLSPIDQWYQQRVCLLGDAAHATTPNLGQGACQAVEDAFFLAESMLPGVGIETAFKNYQLRRFEKANKIVSLSRKMGNLAHWDNPIARSFRNFMLKNTPDAVVSRQNAYIYSIDY